MHSLLLLRRVFLSQQVHLPLSSPYVRLVAHLGGRLQSPGRGQLQLVAPSPQAGSQRVDVVTRRRYTAARLGRRQGNVQRRQSTTYSSSSPPPAAAAAACTSFSLSHLRQIGWNLLAINPLKPTVAIWVQL